MKSRIAFLDPPSDYKPFPKVMKHKTLGAIVGFTSADQGAVLYPGRSGYRLFRLITDTSGYMDIDSISLDYVKD